MRKNEKHGESYTKLYKRWATMHSRVSKSHNSKYYYYEKGIKVCEEWHSFSKFKIWALLNGYAQTLDIDRKDGKKDYCPDNCHFIPHKQNCRNKKDTIKILFNGDYIPLIDLCETYGIIDKKEYSMVCMRVKRGWDVINAMTTPSMRG